MKDDLIGRLEAATGPDRELDRDIADALGFGPPADWQRKPRKMPCGGVYLDCGSWVSPSGGRMRHSERYTAGIDAALTLADSETDPLDILEEALASAREDRVGVVFLPLHIVIAALRAMP